jgi:hypothetical protein
MFRGPNTNDMKKEDGPSLSWPTPHTIPFFLPPEDPFPVLLRPPKTPFRSYSAITPPHYGNPTPHPSGGRGSVRRGRGMGGQNGLQADADALRHPRHSATV